MFVQIRDAILVIIVCAILIWAALSSAKAQDDGPRIIPLPTVCVPTPMFIERIQAEQWKMFAHKEAESADDQDFAIFINKDALMVVLNFGEKICIMAKADDVEINGRLIRRKDF
jgi:hypothetical protein